jgi:hypothetical protein
VEQQGLALGGRARIIFGWIISGVGVILWFILSKRLVVGFLLCIGSFCFRFWRRFLWMVAYRIRRVIEI